MDAWERCLSGRKQNSIWFFYKTRARQEHFHRHTSANQIRMSQKSIVTYLGHVVIGHGEAGGGLVGQPDHAVVQRVAHRGPPHAQDQLAPDWTGWGWGWMP
jgi:hypothetical protein